jgi:hypothetical protein
MQVGDVVDGMGAIAAAIVDGTHASGESPSNDKRLGEKRGRGRPAPVGYDKSHGPRIAT